jgi:hypothetical protein
MLPSNLRLTDLEPRAAVFERRNREKDPDKKIYGRPQNMAAKVLFVCNAFAEARAHAEELEDALWLPYCGNGSRRMWLRSKQHRNEWQRSKRQRSGDEWQSCGNRRSKRPWRRHNQQPKPPRPTRSRCCTDPATRQRMARPAADHL